MDFKKELKRVRAEKALTQKDAYQLIGVPSRTFETWESADRTPPEYVQKLIIKELKRVKIMKKYNVTCVTDKSAEHDNYVGDYIIAETPDEAIKIAIECIRDEIYQATEYKVNCFDDKIEVYDNDEIVETYYDFKAKKIDAFSGELYLNRFLILHLKQNEMADLLGAKLEDYKKWEAGESVPDEETQKHILDIFNRLEKLGGEAYKWTKQMVKDNWLKPIDNPTDNFLQHGGFLEEYEDLLDEFGIDEEWDANNVVYDYLDHETSCANKAESEPEEYYDY